MYRDLDPLVKREQFLISLRREKRHQIIALKRRRIAQQAESNKSYNGFAPWQTDLTEPLSLAPDQNYEALFNQILKATGKEQLAAIQFMRLNYFGEELIDYSLVDANLLKVLIKLIDKNNIDEIDRHVALNSYWILS